MIQSRRLPKNSFSADSRLRKSREFETLGRSGQRLSAKHFLIFIAPSQTERCRLGITVSRKVDGRAVVRNKIKRYIREWFRQERQRLTKPLELVIIARSGAGALTSAQLRLQIETALAKKGFLN